MHCNFVLGYARDEQNLLQRAIAYVEAQGVWTDSDTEHYEQIGVQQFYDAWSKVVGRYGIVRHNNRWTKYGLPQAASWAIFERRAITRCQLCEQRFDFDHPQGLGLMSPVLDHTVIDGRTVIRGVIHQRCNALLGQAKDDPVLLAKMVDYIQRAETQPLEERHSTLLDAYLEAFGDDHSAAFRALAMTEQETVDVEDRS